MTLLILAAGFATRLEPLTLTSPKQLLPLGNGRFVIDLLIDSLKNYSDDFDQMVLVTNQKYYQEFVDWASNQEIKIKVLSDGVNSKAEKLGAVGDFLFVQEKEKINDDILVCASDYVLKDFDFRRFFDLAKNKNSSVTIAKTEDNLENLKDGSCLQMDDDGRVLRFAEKPQKPFSNKYGVPYYIIRKGDLPLIRSIEKNKFDNAGELISKLVKDSKVYAVEYNRKIIHLTNQKDYQDLVEKSAKGLI